MMPRSDVKVQKVSTLGLECKELESEQILQRTVRVTHFANMMLEVVEMILSRLQLLFPQKLQDAENYLLHVDLV